MKKLKVFIESSGCTRRKLEVAKFYRYFKANRYKIIRNPDKADYILLATCAFKEDEQEYSLSKVKMLSKHKGKMLVYGCLPDIAPAKYRAFCNIEYLAPKDIFQIDRCFPNILVSFKDIEDPNVIPAHVSFKRWRDAIGEFFSDFEISKRFLGRVFNYAGRMIEIGMNMRKKRFYLFTSRGCLGKCSYCAIKYAVGSLRSRPFEKIVNEFKEGINSGHRNFVILGDDVGAYGVDINCKFPFIIEMLLKEGGKFINAKSDGFRRGGELIFM